MKVFVTGGSGWVGSALVPTLIAAGHEVTGLARSDASAAALKAAGAAAIHGTLDDVETLRSAAASADGVIHLAFKHDLAFTGDFAGAAAADRLAVETFADALAGSDRPFVLASGLGGLAHGATVTEEDVAADAEASSSGVATRQSTAAFTLSLASRGIRASVVRLPFTTHGEGDNGFMTALVGVARQKGVSAYVGDGANRWPAVHRSDAVEVFRLALDRAPHGTILHAMAEEGVELREIAEVIGRHLNVPVVSVSPEEAPGHFGWLSGFVATDGPASSALTRARFGWHPTHPGLIEDLEKGHYFA